MHVELRTPRPRPQSNVEVDRPGKHGKQAQEAWEDSLNIALGIRGRAYTSEHCAEVSGVSQAVSQPISQVVSESVSPVFQSVKLRVLEIESSIDRLTE